MDSVRINNVNIYRTNDINPIKNVVEAPAADNSIKQEASATPSFKSTLPTYRDTAQESQFKVRTALVTKDEKKQYNKLFEELDSKYRKKLEYSLKTGLLLKNNSNDKSTVLNNLYKIITEERDPGLDKNKILEECLDILANPYVITQTGEDIPKEYKKQIIGLVNGLSEDPKEIAETNWQLDNLHTGTCPAASIEFDLATKHTAEFFRMVEGLTSPRNEVTKTIKMDSLSDKSSDAIWLLNTFKTPHQMKDFETAEVLLKPDENAIVRARIQNHHRNGDERSVIDVLMQSTLMQLGSQQTYNSLTDKRAPNLWTEEDGGLIDFEKTYVESVVEDKNTTSVTYQKVDQNGKLAGYEKDFGTIKKELLETLKMGHNIIVGITWPDPDNGGRLAGHEITIVAYKPNPNGGEGTFIYQDSDDGVAKPVEIGEKELLRSIHHAGLPDEIASKDFDYKDSWEIGVEEFSNMKKQK